MSSYYPRWKARLFVRLESYDLDGQVATLNKRKTKEITQHKGIRDSKAPLKVKGFKAGDRTYYAFEPTEHFSGLSYKLPPFDVVPFNAKLGLNGFTQADTLSLTFRYNDLPLDARLIRACGVEFYLGTVPEDTAWSTETKNYGGLPDESPIDGRTWLRFQGFVDKFTNTWGDEGEAHIELACRDNSSILMDQTAVPGLHVGLTEKMPCDQAIATYLSNYAQVYGLTVEYYPPTPRDKIPSFGTLLDGVSFQPKFGVTPSQSGGAGSQGTKLSVWDYLTDLTGAIGHLIRLEGTRIYIQPARTLYSDAAKNEAGGRDNTRREDDPFTYTERRLGEKKEQPRYRRLVFGYNASGVDISRSFTRSAPSNIEVRCYHASKKRLMVSRWPKEKTDRIVSMKGEAAEHSFQVIPVYGLASQEQLNVLAQTYYEASGRNELSLNIATADLASVGGSNDDPDILDLRAGDTIEFHFDATSEATEGFLEDARRGSTGLANYITGKGFPREFAEQYARAALLTSFQQVFRVRGVGFDCSNDSGVSVNLHVVNYIEARGDKVYATEDKKKSDQKGTGNQKQKQANPVDQTRAAGVRPPTSFAKNQAKEDAFQEWFKTQSAKTGGSTDPDDPANFYDYRAAYNNGAVPVLDSDGRYVWPDPYRLGPYDRSGAYIPQGRISKPVQTAGVLDLTVRDGRINNGRPTNIPLSWNNERLTPAEAIVRAARSGVKFDSYNTLEEARAGLIEAQKKGTGY